MAGSIIPGRNLERNAGWVVGDVVLVVLFAWITIVSLRSDAFVAENGTIEGAEWLLALSPTMLLPLRRLAPVRIFAAAAVLYLLISLTLGNSNAPLAAPLFSYTVGISRRPAESASIVFTAAAVLAIATLFGPGDPDLLTAIVWFLLFGSGWAIATSIQQNRDRADQLTDEVSQLEAQQEQVARDAAAAERARIARELHDAVGHAVNVIVLQAGATRLAGDPERALEVLGEIERVGRSALVDLDDLLGLLDGADEAALAPSRTVADIVALVEELRAGGTEITLDNQCNCQLDWRTGAAAHRIAQEALTNALKHAGEARIDLTMSCDDRNFHLMVVDDGLGVKARPSISGGRGIPGMSERARVLGGKLTAAPDTNGGFVVEAILPRAPTGARANSRDDVGSVPS